MKKNNIMKGLINYVGAFFLLISLFSCSSKVVYTKELKKSNSAKKPLIVMLYEGREEYYFVKGFYKDLAGELIAQNILPDFFIYEKRRVLHLSGGDLKEEFKIELNRHKSDGFIVLSPSNSTLETLNMYSLDPKTMELVWKADVSIPKVNILSSKKDKLIKSIVQTLQENEVVYKP
jgi:hypothetical protein